MPFCRDRRAGLVPWGRAYDLARSPLGLGLPLSGKDRGFVVRVAVIGAGIGGLTAAIALRRSGAEVAVFERAGELKATGAGLLLAPNAVKALGRIGLARMVAEIGAPGASGNVLSWRAEVLMKLDASELSERVGADSYAVHRADLQAALLRELGEDAVRLGRELVGFGQDGAGVTARFTDGTGERASPRAWRPPPLTFPTSRRRRWPTMT